MWVKIKKKALRKKIKSHAVLVGKTKEAFITDVVWMPYSTYKTIESRGSITGKQYLKLQDYVKLEDIVMKV